MTLKVACQCGKRFIAPPQLAGKSVNCPDCGSKIAIAALPTPSPGSPLSARPAPPRIAGVPSADDGIVVACLCGQRFKAPNHLAGQHLPCPVCKQPILIPTPVAGLEPLGAAETPLTSNDLWNEMPHQQTFSSPQPSWPPPAQQASPHSAIAHQYMADAYRQDVEKRQDLDIWGSGQIYSGIFTMTIAAIWFCSGLLVGTIFFFPPVMFIGGAIALINGISQKLNRR